LLCKSFFQFNKSTRRANFITHPAKAGYFTYRDRLFRLNRSALRIIIYLKGKAAISLLEISGVKQNDPP